MDKTITLDSADVIKAFDKLPFGSPLLISSPCGVFYGHIANAGDTLIMKGKKEYMLFHVDYDDEIETISDKNSGWNVESIDDRTTISIIFPQVGSLYTIRLSLHHSLGENKSFLRFLKQKQKLKVNFLGIAHGEIIKRKSFILKLPKALAENIQA